MRIAEFNAAPHDLLGTVKKFNAASLIRIQQLTINNPQFPLVIRFLLTFEPIKTKFYITITPTNCA